MECKDGDGLGPVVRQSATETSRVQKDERKGFDYDEGQFCKISQDFRRKNNGQLSMLCLNVNGLPSKVEEIELWSNPPPKL